MKIEFSNPLVFSPGLFIAMLGNLFKTSLLLFLSLGALAPYKAWDILQKNDRINEADETINLGFLIISGKIRRSPHVKLIGVGYDFSGYKWNLEFSKRENAYGFSTTLILPP